MGSDPDGSELRTAILLLSFAFLFFLLFISSELLSLPQLTRFLGMPLFEITFQLFSIYWKIVFKYALFVFLRNYAILLIYLFRSIGIKPSS